MKSFKLIVLCLCLIFTIIAVTFGEESINLSKFRDPIPFNVEDIKLTDIDLPTGYSFSNELYCYSLQAQNLYNNPGFSDFLTSSQFSNKQFQGINGPNGDKGSILYIQYKEDLNSGAKSFLKGFIWGADSPSEEHPEEIFINGKNLIVWSFPKDSTIKYISQKKLFDILEKTKIKEL